MELKLYNTLTRKKQVFKPIKKNIVGLYDCGPTVYFYAHIGNMWRYVVSDILRRTLEYNGYKVKQVMNITDVGHLTEDDLAADTGEDKMVVAAKKEKKTPEQIADFYTQAFFRDTKRLNILQPHVASKATKHIQEMIDLIKILEKKGYAYWASDKYFVYDIAKFKHYGKLSGKKLDELQVGARLEPVPGKKNPFDFALWIKDSKHLMHWDSPWGVGYPGWHIECSAMSMKYLGETLDIHTGGEDNIFPHHENEIAQSEAATGKQFVRYWLHVRHNLVDGEKMSKSKGSFYILQDLIDKEFNPLACRYLCLNTHYRTNLNFTWEALQGAQNALNKLYNIVREIKPQSLNPNDQLPLIAKPSSVWQAITRSEATGSITNSCQKEFLAAINDDLNMPQALAVMWNLIKTKDCPSGEKYKLLLDFDKVFGLGLDKIKPIKIPEKVKKLVKQREKYRKANDFKKSDEIRKQIEKLGFKIEDSEKGPQLKAVVKS